MCASDVCVANYVCECEQLGVASFARICASECGTMDVCVVNNMLLCVHVGCMASFNVRSAAIKGTNLGDELRKECNIGCEWSMHVTNGLVIKNTNLREYDEF